MKAVCCKEYGTPVEAGTVYGYTVLEDATILIVFDARPMVSEYSAGRGAY